MLQSRVKADDRDEDFCKVYIKALVAIKLMDQKLKDLGLENFIIAEGEVEMAEEEFLKLSKEQRESLANKLKGEGDGK